MATATEIHAKEAVEVAIRHATELLGERSFQLEEIERASHKSGLLWSITLSYHTGPPIPPNTPNILANLQRGALRYKKFLIHPTSGELVAMKLRIVDRE